MTVSESRGFTLLEMLVTITLSAVIIASLSGTAWIVFRQISQAGTAGKVPVTDDFLRLSRCLSGLVPCHIPGVVSFEVNPEGKTRLTSICSLGGSLPESRDIALVTLTFRQAEGIVLSVDETLGASEDVASVELFRGINTFRLLCLDKKGQWVDHWNSTDRPDYPRAIRVDIGVNDFVSRPDRTWTIMLPAGEPV
jgi:prepilin-type N-terminal cleavage/methylation domain-containing protein